jgi:hypothetical protein
MFPRDHQICYRYGLNISILRISKKLRAVADIKTVGLEIYYGDAEYLDMVRLVELWENCTLLPYQLKPQYMDVQSKKAGL